MPDRLMSMEEELGRARRLIEASYALHTSLDLAELLSLILEAALDGTSAERGTVFLLDGVSETLWSKVLVGDEHLTIRLPVGQGIAGCVAATGEVVRLDDVREDPRFDSSWDERTGYRTRQMLCAPIRHRSGEIVGVFQLLNKRAGTFDGADVEYLEALSVHAALAIENARWHATALEKERMAREVRLAQRVQRALQPERRVVTFQGFRVACWNQLCEDATGDYYDVLAPGPNGRLCVAIGDATGHGLQAALVMAEARAFLRAFGMTVESLPRAVELANRFLAPDMTDGKFMTLFAAILDGERGQVEWCNAGHEPPLLCRAATGAIERLARTGPMLGMMEDVLYEAGFGFTFEAGDTLLLFTDGVTEARNAAGELYGEERLQAAFVERAGAEPEIVLDGLLDAVRTWSSGNALDDDLTLVVVQRAP
ncbi:MAG: SpoIIE family protein phosphatase [Planctomycetes bacterium]|nr:SpoIIE family protein phosphatase [Planctomycetota bacterium]